MREKKKVLVILILLFGLNLMSWAVVYELKKTNLFEVVFFDVGQGDAIFIKTPFHQNILIDGGPDAAILEKLGEEMPFWNRTIDMMILTHPEYDHMGGLIEVLKSYEVKNILWTGVKRDTAQYQEWLKLIEEEEAEVVIVSEPMNIYFGGREKQPIFYILRPLGNLEGKEINNINNTSIVARLVFGETSFLFTGDISKSIERSLVSYSSNGKIVIDSDILKVSHHGSKSSTAKEFIEAVSPDAAIIQCGKDNRYGHPHSQVLLNLEGIDILRTDINGDIRITIDDSQYKISTEN